MAIIALHQRNKYGFWSWINDMRSVNCKIGLLAHEKFTRYKRDHSGPSGRRVSRIGDPISGGEWWFARKFYLQWDVNWWLSESGWKFTQRVSFHLFRCWNKVFRPFSKVLSRIRASSRHLWILDLCNYKCVCVCILVKSNFHDEIGKCLHE